MRLLYCEDGQYLLTEDIQQPPPYIVLSHTWGNDSDEVTFKDIRDGTGEGKPGWFKLSFMAERAREAKVDHFWVDTCCINKDSESELATAIRSMFKWYADAQICFVYLQDVNGKRGHDGTELWMQKCRWITRGWTLQELLAPIDVRFYGPAYLGDRTSLCDALHIATGIDKTALQGRSLDSFSHKTRLGWAANRQTKKIEDMAYCLIGLCGVSMSPLYGEGELARSRLERKITKRYGSIALEAVTRPTVQCDNPMERLKFDVIESRKQTISKALNKTCAWVLTHPMFQAWQHGFFWIKGKPGAGKSVLVRFVDNHMTANKEKDDICISFYFHARGDTLEKSFLGLYRSLLYQLLTAVPDLQSMLSPTKGFESSIEALQTTFSRACLKLGRRKLFIFIDALDECKDDDVSQMIEFFMDLGQAATDNSTTILTCFASRHYPVLEVPTQLQLTLEDVDQHSNDLERYVRHHLKLGSPKHVNQVTEQILSKANGIFLWVVLVVTILKKEFASGRIHAVKRRLEEVPPDLYELFKDIIRHDSENLKEFTICLKWILYAMRPMELPEFYFALMVSLGENGVWDQELVNEEQMLRFLMTSSKGLAEITRAKKPKVQFIHESVRDFLVTADGLDRIDGEQHRSVSQEHDVLARSCARMLHDDSLVKWERANLFCITEDRKGLVAHLPFLEYATMFVLHHCNEAAPADTESDASQAPWLQVNLEQWQHAWNMFQTYQSRRYDGACDLVYLCAERGLSKLIHALAARGLSLTTQSPHRHCIPLFAALANKARDAAFVLLSRGGATDAEANMIIHNAVTTKHEGISMFDAAHKTKAKPWLIAIELGFDALAVHLLRNEDLFSARDMDLVSRAAARRDCCEVLKWLKTQGVSFSWKIGGQHNSALVTASAYGHARAVEQLLHLNVDINEIPGGRICALEAASEKGRHEVVEILLKHGAQIQRPDSNWSPALHAAAQCGQVTVIDMLVDAGADVNGSSNKVEGQTPLGAAAAEGHAAAVVKLLSLGADPNTGRISASPNTEEALLSNIAGPSSKTRDYRNTALYMACMNGKANVVRALLTADIELQDDIGQIRNDLSVHTRTLKGLEWLAEKGKNRVLEALDEYEGGVCRGPWHPGMLERRY